jgi:hypothetical protein
VNSSTPFNPKSGQISLMEDNDIPAVVTRAVTLQGVEHQSTISCAEIDLVSNNYILAVT